MAATGRRLSRRQLFRGDLRGERAPLRPPWALPEEKFTERCTRCDRCIDACVPGVLGRGPGGFPEARFSGGFCTFCGDCARVCTEGAIDASDLSSPAAWSLRAQILDHCLACHGVVCRACGDACEPGAIRFRPMPGGHAIPLVNHAACTGCGGCASVCPVWAVRLRPIQQEGDIP